MYGVESSRVFGIAIRDSLSFEILSLIISPLPRSCRDRSILIVLLFKLSGVPRILVVEFSMGIFTSMYFFLSAIILLES